jgi:hypothetical protein
MKHLSYFLIAPREVLTDRLKKLGAKGLADLSDAVIWSGYEHDKGLLSHSDVELLTKLLFLDALNRERKSDNAFLSVFDGLSISGEYFDFLWTIKRVRVDMSVEDAISDAIETGSVQAVGEHGNDRIRDVLLAYIGNAGR